jgi:hypothetical protein
MIAAAHLTRRRPWIHVAAGHGDDRLNAPDLARTLGRGTVAEGVENIEQFRVVRSLGFDDVQGYFLCPPMPLAELLGQPGRDRLDQLRSLSDEPTPGPRWQ